MILEHTSLTSVLLKLLCFEDKAWTCSNSAPLGPSWDKSILRVLLPLLGSREAQSSIPSVHWDGVAGSEYWLLFELLPGLDCKFYSHLFKNSFLESCDLDILLLMIDFVSSKVSRVVTMKLAKI